MPDQGEIVLIPVPFTDLSSAKRRPVIILSNNEYHRATPDMVVVAMTSNATATPYTFTISNDDLTAGTLNRPGTVRADKIYTLSQTYPSGCVIKRARRRLYVTSILSESVKQSKPRAPPLSDQFRHLGGHG